VALKDLIADHRQIAEETIEKIVAPHVRYDPAARKIAWTSQGKSLGSDARILVFLVAVLGWQYVLDEKHEVATKPADLEAELGIPGGTLRPILKRLKDSHLLAVMNGHYRVQLANLDTIEAAIAGETIGTPRKGGGRRASKATPNKLPEQQADSAAHPKKKSRSANQLKTYLTKWMGEGYFVEPRTLSNLQERYHEHGVIAKQTSLSGLMLDAVRDGLLARTKVAVGGKQMWTYRIRSS
jgi:hypothetical protein